MKTMKAIVKSKNEKGVWMEQVPVPEIGINDVLIRIKKTAICGTDIHIYEWNDWAQRTIPVPMTIGHEFVGEVVEVGSNVTSVKVGELVSGEGHVVCGTCRHCYAGKRHLCRKTKGVGVNRNGAFAEYLSIPAVNVWHCDPSIPEELYAIFDPYGNAVHTALSFDATGEDVLVTGAGPIGIMAAAVMQKVGARNVVITDLNPYRVELAKKMGIKNVINLKEGSIKDTMAALKMTEGFDIGLEMSGNAHGFNDLVNNMANGGKVAILGMQATGTTVDWDKVVFNSLTLKGIYGREMFETWYKMQAFLQSGFDLSPIITHRFKVDDFQKGFEVMASGNSGKVILDWEQ